MVLSHYLNVKAEHTPTQTIAGVMASIEDMPSVRRLNMGAQRVVTEVLETFDIDNVLPREFWMDPTLPRALQLKCARCTRTEIAFAVWNKGERLRTCYGCRNCRFRWWH